LIGEGETFVEVAPRFFGWLQLCVGRRHDEGEEKNRE
jgi:hypothetical protein